MTYKTGGIADAGPAIIIGLLIGLIAAQLLTPNVKPTEAQQPAFDHSNCQYPDRWTNPPNGCDNSDPAVPECIKAFSTEQGEKDCIAYYVAQHPVGTAEKQEAIAEHNKPFQEQTNQCGGK